MIDPVIPSKDKVLRARSIQGRMSMRKVKFPRFAPWWADAKNQLMKFPYGAHDDFVDWLAHIGLGLTKELSAESSMPKMDTVPRTGTYEWMIHGSKQRARSDTLNAIKGW